MKNLSLDLEIAISNAIETLGFEIDIEKINSEKLESLMKSKADSFLYTKELIISWQNSLNAPREVKLHTYIEKLVAAGENSIKDLRLALIKKIDTNLVDPEKLGISIRAKQIIFKAITELDAGIIQLKLQLDSGNIDLKTREFTRGFPEKFANQEFFPVKDYYKKWFDEDTESIILCPKGTLGELIVLDNLKIRLPKVPSNKKSILFHNLKKEDQYWRRQPMPGGLIPGNEDQYTEFIIEEFRRRREGVWFMNNGKPVWLTPAHYMGLQWNKMLDTGGYKEFRYAQATMYYFTLACIVDPNCVGELFVKGRRTGFTEEIIDYFVNDSTSEKNRLLGITSKTGDDAQEAFLKYSYTVQNLPFFFMPVVKGKIDDRNKMEFGKVSDNTRVAKKKKDNSTDDYLNTKADWMNTTTLAYDSKRLYRYLCDEGGKREKPNNIIDHWNNVKPTMINGGRVVGKCFMGSTLNPLDKGGAEFQTLYYGSDVTKRNDNGRTSTGLYSFFLPAHLNMEDYTDIYGVCHTVVSKGDHFYNAQGVKKTMGSLQFLENEFKSAKLMGGKVYNNTRRLDPISIEDAFRDELSSQLFDIEKINCQLSFNRNTMVDNTLVRGNFSFKDGNRDSGIVEWNPTERGRFLISWMPPPEMRNKFVVKPVFGALTKCPVNDFGCLGADSYDQMAVIDSKLIETENGQEYNLGSKGAISGVTGFNMDNVPSNYFFLEYVARPQSAEMFFEDVLMSCIFYSIPILIENNKKMLLEYIYSRGYRGFSVNRFDRAVNRLSPDEKRLGGMPNSSPDIINKHWTAIESYINNYVGEYSQLDGQPLIREEGIVGSMPFNRTLIDWLKFNISDRTKFDLSISSGLALMGVNRHNYILKQPMVTKTMAIKRYSISY